jgi:hypothetical protein
MTSGAPAQSRQKQCSTVESRSHQGPSCSHQQRFNISVQNNCSAALCIEFVLNIMWRNYWCIRYQGFVPRVMRMQNCRSGNANHHVAVEYLSIARHIDVKPEIEDIPGLFWRDG